MQVAGSPYTGIVNCITRMTHEEGIAAFFKSYKTTVGLKPASERTVWADIQLQIYQGAALLLYMQCNLKVVCARTCAVCCKPGRLS